MKYWSFWYFWSNFALILAAMCNINTQIPVYQNQRSHAEQITAFCLAPAPHPPAPLAGPVVLATALGWAVACEHTQRAGDWYISALTPLLGHNGFCRGCQRLIPLSAEQPGILRQPGGKAFPCLTAWHCYLESQRWQKWGLQCLWESLTPTCLQQILRNHSEELWDLVFLHFAVSGHYHPEL